MPPDPPDPADRIIVDAAKRDATELRKLGSIVRSYAAELQRLEDELKRLRTALGEALGRNPLRGAVGFDEVEDPRIAAVREALTFALSQIDALALPRPADHVDDILRGFGMNRPEIATAQGVTEHAVHKRRFRRNRQR